jgi:acyl-CoA thioesterase-2
MGDLAADTAVEGEHGHYTASLSEDWRIWGPMGGYIAAVALRACAAEVDPSLPPASFSCQFASSARFDTVDIAVEVRRSSSRTALVSARLTQDGAPVLDAQAWFARSSTEVLHDHAPEHRYGSPDDHAPFDFSAIEPARFPFWENFDAKMVDFVEDWEHYPGGEPRWGDWLQFLPTASFTDPLLEACRLVLLADLPSFPAAIRAHAADNRDWIAPNLDLSVQLHRLDALTDWLLVQGFAPVADRGLCGFRSEVWTGDGRLAATGSGQLLCRPAPPLPG